MRDVGILFWRCMVTVFTGVTLVYHVSADVRPIVAVLIGVTVWAVIIAFTYEDRL